MSDALKRLIEAVEVGDESVNNRAIEAIPQWASLIIAAHRGSLDAAKALHDALLPGWRMRIEQAEIVDHGDAFTACVWPNDYTRREQVFRPSGEATDPARAWLLAVLRAYQQVQA